jgi:hypothetical protein
MLIKTKSPVGLFSGRTGGAHGIIGVPHGGRQIAKSMARPPNPMSIMQRRIRSATSQTASAFSTLTDSEKRDWAALGEQLSREDTYNNPYPLSAFDAFQSVNIYRNLAGWLPVTAAPPYEPKQPITSTYAEAAPASIGLTVIHPLASSEAFFVCRVTPMLASPAAQARSRNARFCTQSIPQAIQYSQLGGQQIFMDLDNISYNQSGYIGVLITTLTYNYVPVRRFWDPHASLTFYP